MFLVTSVFVLVLILLNQMWSPPLRFQVSHYSTFLILCVVPSAAVFSSQLIECVKGMASKFFFELFITIPMVSIITGMFLHFIFHICFIFIHKLSYLIPFLLVLCGIPGRWYCYICQYTFFFLNFYISRWFLSFLLSLLCANAANSTSSIFHIFRRQISTFRFHINFSVTS